jgi:hypothetical protein
MLGGLSVFKRLAAQGRARPVAALATIGRRAAGGRFSLNGGSTQRRIRELLAAASGAG